MTRAPGWCVALLLVLGACMGVGVRDRALPPGMSVAFVSVRTDVAAGVAAAKPSAAELETITADLATIEAAVNGGDRSTLIGVGWARLAVLAETGVLARAQRGEIGPGVAQSRLERIRLFGESMAAAVSR